MVKQPRNLGMPPGQGHRVLSREPARRQGDARMPTATEQPDLADAEGLAESRERFLSAEPVEPAVVRDTILASWWRSRDFNVAADHIQLPYLRDPDADTPLTRSAEPVLRTLRDQMEGQQVRSTAPTVLPEIGCAIGTPAQARFSRCSA